LADEDGILHQILKRLGINCGTFLEIGVGDGRENNTAYLLAKGWSGAWVDANSNHISQIRRGLACLLESAQLRVFEMLVGPGNVGRLKDELYFYQSIDVFSLDIDGVDFHVATELFKDNHFHPKVVIVEYNGVFPPPLQFVMPLNSPIWHRGDFYGASYSAWVSLFLICTTMFRLAARRPAAMSFLCAKNSQTKCCLYCPRQTVSISLPATI
jgi:hypothetical protein